MVLRLILQKHASTEPYFWGKYKYLLFHVLFHQIKLHTNAGTFKSFMAFSTYIIESGFGEGGSDKSSRYLAFFWMHLPLYALRWSAV